MCSQPRPVLVQGYINYIKGFEVALVISCRLLGYTKNFLHRIESSWLYEMSCDATPCCFTLHTPIAHPLVGFWNCAFLVGMDFWCILYHAMLVSTTVNYTTTTTITIFSL